MNTSTRSTALVTGASSGIGARLARELARDGHDLVLAARTVERMEALARELEAYGATTTIIPSDLSAARAAASLERDLPGRGLVIDTLINGAGLGANDRFDESDPLRIKENPQACPSPALSLRKVRSIEVRHCRRARARPAAIAQHRSQAPMAGLSHIAAHRIRYRSSFFRS